MKRHWIKKAFFITLIAVAVIVVFGGAVMLLWNGVLTDVLHIGMISFWQAIGLLLLSKILFGGFGPGYRGHFGPWGHNRHHWMHMSEEERTKFREEWKKRCQPSQ
ncbi:MAG: hypothetical protein P4L27_11475 [Ignavibacteriaceae bacterium]|nr:hypothetical protein [Ignavibacteriaceae bacterium]